MTERAFRAAGIDLCRRRLEQTPAFQASMERSEARSHAAYLKREAERQRELEWRSQNDAGVAPRL